MLYKVGQENKADSFVDELLGKNLNDRETKKVKIAYQKSKFNTKEYVDLLVSYLEENYDDSEAWLELAITYEKLLNFDRALYCYEEMLLLNPENLALYLKLAELNYTIGKLENLKVARQYFCFLLNINDKGLRCLWGLLNTCQRLIEVERSNDNNKTIVTLVEEKLSKIYAKVDVIDFK